MKKPPDFSGGQLSSYRIFSGLEGHRRGDVVAGDALEIFRVGHGENFVDVVASIWSADVVDDAIAACGDQGRRFATALQSRLARG